jgi:ureidoglycolate hydrolase
LDKLVDARYRHVSDHDPFVALLALPGDDIKAEDFVAFYFDGSFGVQIHADIWHQQVYPISDRAELSKKTSSIII